VVIHVQHTSLASGAVVTPRLFEFVPFRFKTMAEEAVPSFAVVCFFSKETPVNRYSSWIANYGLGHTPDKHKEQDVEYDEYGDVPFRVEVDHVTIHKDEVVHDDKDQYTNEMRID
jgi:hypothetical protein